MLCVFFCLSFFLIVWICLGCSFISSVFLKIFWLACFVFGGTLFFLLLFGVVFAGRCCVSKVVSGAFLFFRGSKRVISKINLC